MGDTNTNNGIQITGGNASFGNTAVGKNAQANQYVTPEPYGPQAAEPPLVPPDFSLVGTPRIFLSHSHKDNEFCKRLAQSLYSALDNDVASVWYDVEGINGGDAWWNKAVQELTSRNIFLVVLSPDAVASKWVTDEIAIAWKQKNDAATGKRIIPVVYKPCKVPSDLETLQVVSFLPPKPFNVAFGELLRAIGGA